MPVQTADEHVPLSNGHEMLLTFAELQTLLADAPAWPDVWAGLSTRPAANEQVSIAGLATLLIRGLATVTPQGQPEIDPGVAALAGRLGRATVVVRVALADTRTESVNQILLCARGGTEDRIMVRITGPGVTAVSALSGTGDIFDDVAALTGRLLDKQEGAVMIKALGRPGVTIRRNGVQWQVGTASLGVTAQFRRVTREQALEVARSCGNQV